MKARNPSTGTLETVYVKALDSMPVGAEIDFDGDSADIPTGWEQVDDVIKKETINGTTDSNGFITNTGLLLGEKAVISAIIKTSGKEGFVFPYCSRNTGAWTFKVANCDLSPLANTSITIDVYYINL